MMRVPHDECNTRVRIRAALTTHRKSSWPRATGASREIAPDPPLPEEARGDSRAQGWTAPEQLGSRDRASIASTSSGGNEGGPFPPTDSLTAEFGVWGAAERHKGQGCGAGAQ
jgi:hypothetical protein